MDIFFADSVCGQCPPRVSPSLVQMASANSRAAQGSCFAGQPSSSSSDAGPLAQPMLAEADSDVTHLKLYAGPLAQPMLAEPDSDVTFLKPLQNFEGIYSPFSIHYMMRQCGGAQELMRRASNNLDGLPVKGSRGLPMSITVWGSKLKEVEEVDEETHEISVSRVRIYPGLLTVDEEYPYKKEFVAKWRQSLDEIFRPPQTIAEQVAANAVNKHWRFDVLEQLLKSTELQGRSLPSELPNLTLLQWNAGSARQRLETGALSGGSLHFGMFQEVDPDIVASLARWGALVHVHEY